MRSIVTPLVEGWSLRQASRSERAPEVPPIAATVPGCVHTDLLDAGMIPDPFAGTNEEDVAWVADCDWHYSNTFEITGEELAHDRVDLEILGLDTLAEISVNGARVAETANMHRRYRFDIKSDLRVGANRLDIVFRSATRYCDQLRRSVGDWPSSSFGRPFNYLRKMACSWGWDWGPELTTAGIWRPIQIEAWSFGRIGDIRPHVTVDDDRGHVRVEVDYDATQVTKARLRATVVAPTGEIVASKTSTPVVGTTSIELDAGPVARWWPRHLGDPTLYRLSVELLCPESTVQATKQVRIGFRAIELDTAPDATGSAFTLVVNGMPIFARGANWIPDDVFPSRITPERYRERIGQAVEANVDLLRVWGGGVYEDDRFYEICDELGVLVWQDFAFACAAYPESLLADEVEAEAYDNVSRLMHHASLAIWNGNNENNWGFWDWGWRDALGDRAWGAGFYHELLPQVCTDLDPGRPYWPGSPWSGSDAVAPNADTHGCVHVWDVWNDLDLIRYRDHTPRFASEFGWQAPPSMRTLTEYVSEEQLDRSSAAWRNHQKAEDGDLKLDRGIEPRFGQVADFEAFCYAAHVVQARAIRTGVEHFRSLRPYCMGTIWWQLNDCWPVTSWSIVDGRGRRKPAWFALREAYRSRLLTIQPRGDALVVVAVNETREPWVLATQARRHRYDGVVLAEEPVELAVPPCDSMIRVLPPKVAEAGRAGDEVLVVGDADDRAWWWYGHDRDLDLRTPALDFGHGSDGDDLVLTVGTDTVVRGLTIYPERVRPDATIDRQLVDLLPGESTRFRIRGLAPADVDALSRPPVVWHSAAVLET